jgi:predicted DNA-binding protein (MmcQ/YjbR family)
MNIEEVREYCLQKAEVTEGFPFDDTTLVIKVCGKMFILIALDTGSINLKCDPAKAIEWREQFAAVQPGFHMNKAQWNTIALDGSVPPHLIAQWIDDSYNLVVAKLPKKIRENLQIKKISLPLRSVNDVYKK